MSQTIHKAVVVDDFIDAAHWLETALRLSFPGVEVTIADTLSKGRSAVRTVRPDLIVVDLGLPDGSGVDLIAEVREKLPNTPAIVATVYDDDRHIFPALRAGACGYLLKEESQENLVRQLQALVRGELPLSPSVARSVMEYFTASRPQGERLEDLTPREREILAALASGDTLAQVAEHFNVSRNTVATHVKRVYDKLNVSTRAEATIIAVRLGIINL